MHIEGTPEQQAALFKALVAARKQFKPISKDTTGQEGNRSYKYAPLVQLVDATMPALLEHGLLVMQPFSINGEKNEGVLTTILQHESGARLVDTSTFPLENDIKLIGGQSTYMARYAYQRLLVLDGEDDADNHDSKARLRQDSKPAKKPMTPEQDNRIQSLAKELGINAHGLGELCKQVTGVYPDDTGFDECAKLIAHMAKMMNEKAKQKAGQQ